MTFPLRLPHLTIPIFCTLSSISSHHGLTIFHFSTSFPSSPFCSVEPTFLIIILFLYMHIIYITSVTDTQTHTTTDPDLSFSLHVLACAAWLLSFHPSPPFGHSPVSNSITSGYTVGVGVSLLWNPPSSSSYRSITSFMGQCLSLHNPASHRIGARPGSRVVTVADGGDRIPDDGVLEEATVAVTSTMLLRSTRSCTLTLGMSLFGPTLSWPLKAPPWTSGRTKLDVADPHLRHSEEEEQERQIDDDDWGFCCCTGNTTLQLADEVDQQGYVPPTSTTILTATTNAEEWATLAHAELEAMRQLVVWSRFRSICCTSCNDLCPLTYVHHVLETYAVSGDSSGSYSYCKFCVEYFDYCEKLEGTEGKSHSIFMLHPLRYLSPNACTTLYSAHLLRASDFLSLCYEVNVDLLEPLDKSRTVVLNILSYFAGGELIADKILLLNAWKVPKWSQPLTYCNEAISPLECRRSSSDESIGVGLSR